ncbi:MAG: substrate-binding domain-containing protein [Gammaproteobacteria bacterium]|nr:substrate-binding domain-containing protein [Gammaproteobacteria bacterium]MDH5802684.1 substrate-binding domain-containing protein [Gammaproteobacteria bacterium]
MDDHSITLDWPFESARSLDPQQRWFQSESNLCLDFHGDPCRAGLAVFSDGNHHMALEETLQTFLSYQPDLEDIFYATTPPGVLVELMQHGRLHLGNLTLSRQPDVFIGPDNILSKMAEEGRVHSPKLFMRSRCNVMLVRKGNPRKISGIHDLLRSDVRVFISNPKTEKASYQVYSETVLNLAVEQGDSHQFEKLFANELNNMVYGQRIHHRELPQALAANRADVAVLYYHLALRYTRIFPDLFEILPLGGTSDAPAATAAHHLTDYHVAVVNPDNPFVEALMVHLFSDQTTEIYSRHGLDRP